MAKFYLTAFADESSKDFDTQLCVLKSHNIKNIEIRGVNGKNIVDHTLEEAKDIKAQLDKACIKVSSIGSPIGKVDITSPFESHVELMKHTLELAGILDSPFIRIFSFYLPEGEDPLTYRDEVMERLRLFAEMAAQKGIILLHENEDGLYGFTASRCLDIMQTVDHPNLRAVMDTANFVVAGDINYPDVIKMLRPYIVYMHIKDAVRGGIKGNNVPAGDGDGQIKEVLSYLKNTGFKGFISLEPHLTTFEGRAALARIELVQGKGNGIEKFALAVNSLKRILDEIDVDID